MVSPRSSERRLDIPPACDIPDAPVEETRSIGEWTVQHDADRSVFRMERGGTEVQPDLTYTTDQWWTVAVDDDDPGSTRASTVSRVSLQRPGWQVTTEGTIDIEGGDTFDVRIELAAEHNGDRVFHRIWSESIPRRLV